MRTAATTKVANNAKYVRAESANWNIRPKKKVESPETNDSLCGCMRVCVHLCTIVPFHFVFVCVHRIKEKINASSERCDVRPHALHRLFGFHLFIYFVFVVLCCWLAFLLSLSLSVSAAPHFFFHRERETKNPWSYMEISMYFWLIFSFISFLLLQLLRFLRTNLWYCLELFGLLALLNSNALALSRSFSIFICHACTLVCLCLCIIHFCSFVHSLYLSAYWVHSLFWVILPLNIFIVEKKQKRKKSDSNKISAHAAGSTRPLCMHSSHSMKIADFMCCWCVFVCMLNVVIFSLLFCFVLFIRYIALLLFI